jgi:RNase P subunit RPR2
MDAGKIRQCPICGYFLVESEKMEIDSTGNLRFDPMVICPGCGWKGRDREVDSPDRCL